MATTKTIELNQAGIDRLWRALVLLQLEEDHDAGSHADSWVVGCDLCAIEAFGRAK